jgi:hypothetical protein
VKIGIRINIHKKVGKRAPETRVAEDEERNSIEEVTYS